MAAVCLIVLIKNLFWDYVIVVKEFITRYFYHNKYLNKLPGPKRYPIIGNYFQFFYPFGELFQRFREYSKTYPDIYLMHLGHMYIVNMWHPDDVQAVLRNPRHVSKCFLMKYMEYLTGENSLPSLPTNDLWKTSRRLLTPAFHFNCLPGFVQEFNEHADNLIQDLSKLEGSAVDVLPIIVMTTTNYFFGSSLKMDEHLKEKQDFIAILSNLMDIMGERVHKPWCQPNILNDLFSKGRTFMRLSNIVKENFYPIISEREEYLQAPENYDTIKENEKNKTIPMIDLLISSKQKGLTNSKDMAEQLIAFTAANSYNSGIVISITLMLLACHKNIQEAVHNEIIEVLGDKKQPTHKDLENLKYMERCLKESMRLYPTGPIICRTSGEDFVSKSGHLIPKDAPLLLHVYDLHRRPDYWPEPERFDPDRFLPESCQKRHPFAYVPFGAGDRSCIGQRFAWFEMKSIMCAVLRNYSLEPIDRQDTLAFMVEAFLLPKEGVKVKLVKRNL